MIAIRTSAEALKLAASNEEMQIGLYKDSLRVEASRLLPGARWVRGVLNA